MKTEMAMLPNGNYESIMSPIQHLCHSPDHIWRCVQYSWEEKLQLEIKDGDPYEDGYSANIYVNYCPYCGLKAET